MAFLKLLRDLIKPKRLHLIITLALITLFAYLLFLSQGNLALPVAEAVQPATAIIVEDAESVMIVNLNARQQAENQDEPEHEFSLAFTNKQAFTTDNTPAITFEGFIFVEDDSNSWEFAAADEEADYLAHSWVSGTQTLTDLAEDAVNDLDFVIDVPQAAEDGSYTVAIVIRDQADEILGYQLLILNIGNFEQEDDLDLAQSGFDLKTGAEVRVVITNEGQWHANGSPELQLTDGSDSLSTQLVAENDDFIGLFPNFEQTFIADTAPEIKKLEDFIAEADDLEAEIVFLDTESQAELATWDIKAEIDIPSDGDDPKKEKEDDDQAQAASTSGTDKDTTISTSPGIGTFLVDNIFIVVGAGGALVLLIILFIMMRRRKRPTQFKVSDKAVSPVATSTTPTTTTLPSAENAKPATTVVPATQPIVTDIASDAITGTLPTMSMPVDGEGLNASASDNVAPQPVATDIASDALVAPLPDPVAPIPQVDLNQPSTPPTMAMPALEGMPQLPNIDEGPVSSGLENNPVTLPDVDTSITPPPEMNTNITPPADSDNQPPPPEQNPN